MAEAKENLTCVVATRISRKTLNRLEKLRAQSNVQTIGEFVRAIVLKEKINWYHRNAELETLALEFALIRKELNAIGKNINQVTRAFHTSAGGQRIVHALKAEAEYRKVEGKIDQLLRMMEGPVKSWLRK